MSISHRTNRLKLVGSPSVEQLQNGRYKLIVTCSTMNSREDWYSANKARIFPDFGSLQSAEMLIDGLAPRTGEAYANMRLTKVESGNRSGMGEVGEYNIELTYETLTNIFVQSAADKVDFEINGLMRITRSVVALEGAEYPREVGTGSYITSAGHGNPSDSVTLYLASAVETPKRDNEAGYVKIIETWVQAGIINRGTVEIDNGALKQQVTSYLAIEPTAIGVVTSRQVGSFEGLSTFTVTEILSPDGTSVISPNPKLISKRSDLRPFPVPGLIRLKESERKITKTNNNTIPPTRYATDSINYSFELFGPVDSISKHTTYEFIQTESEIQVADYTYGNARGLWSPPSWARSTISGIDITGKPFSVSKAYRGYRSPSNLLSFAQRQDTVYTGYSYGYKRQVSRLLSIDGNVISSLFIDGYEMSNKVPPIIEISGGPEDPVGNTYVTDVRIVPDFVDDNNVQYYKKYITTAYVDADTIDEADVNNISNNRLSSYTFTSEPSGNLSITLDPTLLASEDDFYVGAKIEIYPRNKDAANKFQGLQNFMVYDYDSSNNKLLLKPISGYTVPSQLVGLYDGTGDVSANGSYDFARLSITKYGTTGTIKYSANALMWLDSDNNKSPAAYVGWTFKITSGTFDGDTYTIATSSNNYVGLTTLPTGPDSNYVGATFELIPPQSF